eukprot:3655911-Amphidinium_carterae.1
MMLVLLERKQEPDRSLGLQVRHDSQLFSNGMAPLSNGWSGAPFWSRLQGSGEHWSAVNDSSVGHLITVCRRQRAGAAAAAANPAGSCGPSCSSGVRIRRAALVEHSPAASRWVNEAFDSSRAPGEFDGWPRLLQIVTPRCNYGL